LLRAVSCEVCETLKPDPWTHDLFLQDKDDPMAPDNSTPVDHALIRAINPATGETLEPAYRAASLAELDSVCQRAADAFDLYRETRIDRRADFLDAIAHAILDSGDELIERGMAETGLPRARLEGERGRTVGQLRLFGNVVREGRFLEARIDQAMPERKPVPRVDLRLRMIGLGPVAVFGASNFPLAFSVAGGDTAAALAAGCPVIVKAHSAHPGTSALVASAIEKAVKACGLPEGTFALLFDSGFAIGAALVADRRVKAVGFTGSRRGGMALMKIAQERPEPIPVYAEMSSINPVLLLPGALASRGAEIGAAFVASLTLGAGQFCTNPGLVLAIEGGGLDAFVSATAHALSHAPAQVMLTPGIAKAYADGVLKLAGDACVATVARGDAAHGCQGQAGFFATHAADFLARQELQAEVFGAASLLVRCRDEAELHRVVGGLEGQLTVALHMNDADHEMARRFLPLLERKAGRILVNGFGTGVEVAHAMVHGGPFPATSDSRSTSVGTLAINRFLRPVCYQDMPDALLPEALQQDNSLHIARLVDGTMRH